MTHITIDAMPDGAMPAIHIGLTSTFDVTALAKDAYPDAKIKRITFVDMHMIRGTMNPVHDFNAKNHWDEADWNIYVRMEGLPDSIPCNSMVKVYHGRVPCENDFGEPLVTVFIGAPFKFSEQRKEKLKCSTP